MTRFQRTVGRPAAIQANTDREAGSVRPHAGVRVILLAIVSLAVLVASPSVAFAGKKVDSWIGSGASGTLGAEFSSPTDVAVNETGTVFVADSANNRVQRFSATGDFQRAWGIDVVQTGGSGDTAGSTFEVCTVAAECQIGQPSGGDGTTAGNGGLSSPQGVAVDQDTGLVYVTDRGNNRVNVYDADGAFQRSFGFDVDAAGVAEPEVCEAAEVCKAGAAGDAAGQFGAGLGRLDVSKSDGGAETGAVFVADTGNRRVAEFTLGGTFARAWGWNVDSADGAGDRFEICESSCKAGDPPGFFGGSAAQFNSGQPVHIAVNAEGIVYATDRAAGFFGGPRINAYDVAATAAGDLFIGSLSGSYAGLAGLEVDTASGHLLAFTSSPAPAGIREIAVTAPSATVVDTHIANSGLNVAGLGSNDVSTSTGLLYIASTTGGHRVYIADQDGAPAPEVTIGEPQNVTDSGATLTGTVDPNGFPNSYRFEYSDDDGATWTPVKANESVGDGDDPVVVDDDLSGLDPATEYRVRLIAVPAFGNDPVTSGELSFTTEAAPPVVTTLPNRGAGDTVATLPGTIDPRGAETTYHFEYGTTTAYGNSVPVPEGSVGDGPGVVTVYEQVDGLESNTTYHYKLVATNEKGTVEGVDQTFTTRPAALAPPGRAYELVSPADKISGIGVGTYASGDAPAATYGRVSRDGERYAVKGIYGAMLLNGDFAYASDYAFAERTDAGWVSHSPFTHPNARDAAHRFAHIYASSADLSLSLWSSNGGHFTPFPQLADAIPLGWGAPHLSDWAGRWEVFAPTDVDQGDPENAALRPMAVSADGSHGVLSVQSTFAGGLSGPGDPNLDRTSGRATYIDDVSAGLSDSFPGSGVREPVGVCDAGTEIPSREETAPGSGVFKLAARNCPPVAAGRDGALVDQRGVSISNENPAAAVSGDGSRLFFMSPHSDSRPLWLTNAERSCTGTGAETTCGSQLYLHHEDEDGSVSTRWISRPEVDGQDASLLGPAIFEGATPDGDKVFFRTSSPLTADDPNGGAVPPPPGGVTAGEHSRDSWDLYRYDFTDDPADDPGAGDLARISAGPTGFGDANNDQGGAASSLRVASHDGDRVYFVTSAPLPGVADPTNGTISGPYAGSVGSNTPRNLYLYEDDGGQESWRFVAQLPADPDGLGACASKGIQPGQPLTWRLSTDEIENLDASRYNCVHGSADGNFVTFLTEGQLTADDPDAVTGDIYGFDADADQLTRLSAPQGGVGEPYKCAAGGGNSNAPDNWCYGDGGIGSTNAQPRLGLVTHPADPTDKVAFFQSKSRLVADDRDDEYDVYQWRNGDLSLLSTGTETPAWYTHNSADGEDVFFMTRDQLSWQDFDRVNDIYDARIGGGIPEPAPPEPVCAVFAGACQGPDAPPAAIAPQTPKTGGGNATPGVRARLAVKPPGRRARRRAARAGVIRLRVRVNRPGRVRAVAKARMRTGNGRRVVRRVAVERVRFREAGTRVLRLRLSRAATRRLRRGQRLPVRVRVKTPGARAKAVRFALRRPRAAHRRSDRRGGRRAAVDATRRAR